MIMFWQSKPFNELVRLRLSAVIMLDLHQAFVHLPALVKLKALTWINQSYFVCCISFIYCFSFICQTIYRNWFDRHRKSMWKKGKLFITQISLGFSEPVDTKLMRELEYLRGRGNSS